MEARSSLYRVAAGKSMPASSASTGVTGMRCSKGGGVGGRASTQKLCQILVPFLVSMEQLGSVPLVRWLRSE